MKQVLGGEITVSLCEVMRWNTTSDNHHMELLILVCSTHPAYIYLPSLDKPRNSSFWKHK